MAYSQGVAPFYDLFAPRGDDESEFLGTLLETASRVLDIGAGAGNTAFELAAGGHDVTALEPDPEMFTVLLSRLALRPELHSRVAPVPAAAGFSFGAVFDLAFSFAVLHLLGETDRLQLAQYAASQVRTGGKVVLEIPVASTARKPFASKLDGECRLGELVYQRHSAMQPADDGWWHTLWHFTIQLKGRVIHEVSRTFHWFPMQPVDALEFVQRAGLAVTDTFGGFSREPFSPGDSRSLIVVSQVT